MDGWFIKKKIAARQYDTFATYVRRDSTVQDTRLTTCTDCRYGIFKHHDFVWTRRGLVHTKCAEGSNETKTTETALYTENR